MVRRYYLSDGEMKSVPTPAGRDLLLHVAGLLVMASGTLDASA